jgi:hypothetical protein
MLKAAVLALLALSAALGGCAAEDPTCAPGVRAFRFCSDDAVWECPVGTPDQIARKKEREDKCKQAQDLLKCLSETETEMVPAVFEADCGGGDMVCEEDLLASPSWASCK